MALKAFVCWKNWKIITGISDLEGSVQFSSVTQSCPTLSTPWTEARQTFLSITNSQNLLKLMYIESVMPSNDLILCHPLLLLPSIFPRIRVFSSWVSSLHQVAQALEFQLQYPMNIQDWFPLGLTGRISKRLSRFFSNTTLQKNQFFGTQPSLWLNSGIHTWLLEKP